MRSMTKSPLRFVQLAHQVGRQALPSYSCKHSRRDFQQAQLFALLALRQFLNTDYRKTSRMVSEWSDLRDALGLQKVPHWTTLEKAQKRLIKKGASRDFFELFSIRPEPAT